MCCYFDSDIWKERSLCETRTWFCVPKLFCARTEQINSVCFSIAEDCATVISKSFDVTQKLFTEFLGRAAQRGWNTKVVQLGADEWRANWSVYGISDKKFYWTVAQRVLSGSACSKERCENNGGGCWVGLIYFVSHCTFSVAHRVISASAGQISALLATQQKLSETTNL